MNTKTNGLELDVPQTGPAADCYNVACTATMLKRAADALGEQGRQEAGIYAYSRHAVTLHRISGQLHRIAERQCNEDLACRECDGGGEVTAEAVSTSGMARGAITYGLVPCPKCAGAGNTLGRKEKRLERQAREIADHYGLLCYFQGDPRGCSLYLIDPAQIPEDLSRYNYPTRGPIGNLRSDLEREWISANYNRGHAVVRIGR